MSLVLQKAKNHFKEQLDNGFKEIDVPEWDCKIHYKPMNALQRDKIMKLVLQNEMFGAAVEAVLMRSLDADGKRMFSDADRSTLMRSVDPSIIDRIAGDMGGLADDTMPEVDDVKK